MRILLTLIAAGVLVACGQSENPTVETSTQKPSTLKQVVEHYENGMVKMRGQTIDGKRTGQWESFYPNGYKWSEAHYLNGMKDGRVVSYYENGIMRYDGAYYKDQRSGLWIIYDTLGRAVKKVNLDDTTINIDSLLNAPIQTP